MLLKIRGKLDSIFVTILLGILIAAFAIWGVGTGGGAVGGSNVAKVGDKEVSAQRFATMVNNQAQQYQAQMGGQMTLNQIIHGFGLIQQILQQQTTMAAFDNETSSLGMRASDSHVAEELISIPAFLLPDGSFSEQMLEQTMRSTGMTRNELLEEIRAGIARQQLVDSLTAYSAVSKDMVNTLQVVQGERRRANMITIKASEIVDIPEADEETLRSYYEANKSNYMTPVRRSYRYLLVTPDQFADKVEISDEDIQTAYDSNIGDWQKPELRNIQQAIFPTAEEAQAFADAVNAGADYATEAAQRTEFTIDELDLGDNTYDDLAVDFDAATADAVFAVAEGTITEPLETLAGYVVYKVTSITPGTERSLEDVRDDVVTLLKAERSVDLMFDFIPELEDALAEDGTLAPVAEKLSLNLATVSAVDRNGRDANGTQVITQQVEATIHAAAFAAEVGLEPEITDLNPVDNTQGIYLVEVMNEMQPEQQIYEDVSVAVRQAWEREQRQLKAGEFADLAVERLRANENPEDVAADLGGTSFDAKNVTRQPDGNSGLAANIRSLIFTIGEGKVSSERSADGDGYVVVKVNEIVPGDPATQAAAVASLRQQLINEQTNTVLSQYQAYLLAQNRPEINNALIEQLFPRDQE
ncbi:hypothetical protein GCM10017044_24480 [Kordiimonas sediminis]|uniref:Parvulin-like PPIase n=1 Tax=Kordiimonas sediminis TaxID=1735581 RepID=A0A919AW30_9PROT|nr:SurA N-terminal domain-containing protein [Kordiimonas sediminis]GHF28377.1 hypothetical protein GCM10017044_24480 [Kordiimonas sediminis]